MSVDMLDDEESYPELYAELRKIAHKHMRNVRVGHTLSATALANEAFMKLHKIARTFASHTHYLRTASKAMGQILIDHAIARSAGKRTAEHVEEPLFFDLGGELKVHPLDLREALEELEENDPDMRALIEMRFFGGLTMEECADVLNRPLSTLEKHWANARAWLFNRLGGRKAQ